MENERMSSYYFTVEIDGIRCGNFLECSGMEMQRTVFEVEEGGLNTTTHKFLGPSRTSNIILKKAISKNNVLLRWYQQVINGNFERKSVSVILMDTAHREIKRWDFYRAWPCRWKGPNLDANDNGFAVEMIEIAVE